MEHSKLTDYRLSLAKEKALGELAVKTDYKDCRERTQGMFHAFSGDVCELSNHDKVLCSVNRRSDCDTSIEERDANARFFALAPVLYDALFISAYLLHRTETAVPDVVLETLKMVNKNVKLS